MESDDAVLNLTPITGSGVHQTGRGLSFSLDKVALSFDFVTLFDEFKILGVMIKVIPETQTDLTASTASYGTELQGYPIPQITYCVDYIDSSNEELDVIQQRSTAKHKSLNKPFSFYVKAPRPALTVYSQPSNGYNTPNTNVWVRTHESNAPHYGAKFVLWVQNPPQQPLPNITYRVKILEKYYLQFRGQH